MPEVAALKPDFSDVFGKRLLIALSGGADSTALAALLAAAREQFALTLFAAHLDHGIRAESARDAEFCRALCKRLDISFFCLRLDIPAEAARLHAGIESLARLRRYEWLERCRDETQSDYIALAHHMDDQAETVLMHLGRGAGPEGIRGMGTLRDGRYRPLLRYRKRQLVDYLVSNGIPWREDITNRRDDNPRNALRLHALPELEQCYPQFVRAAARYAESAGIEDDCLAEQTRTFLSGHAFSGAFGRWLEVGDPPHRAILRRALRAICPQATDWEQVNALEALCAEKHGRLSISPEWTAERTGGRLYFVPAHVPAAEPAALSFNGETRLAGVCTVEARPCAPVPVRDDPLRQALNPEALGGAVLRTRRAGDRIRPLGCGDRLLSDYLTDKKIDRPLRDRVALVAVGNRVHWVCGLGISEEAALGPGPGAIMMKCTYDRENGFYGGTDHAQ